MAKAPSIGIGVRREKEEPLKIEKQKQAPIPHKAAFSQDSPATWLDEPQIAGQITNPKLSRPDRVEIRIFDFSSKEDLEAYTKIRTEQYQPKCNFMFAEKDRQWDSQKGSWKILCELVRFKFRKVVPDESGSSGAEPS